MVVLMMVRKRQRKKSWEERLKAAARILPRPQDAQAWTLRS